MTSAIDPDQIRGVLRRVVDPEVGMNILDLGLIYRIDHEATPVLIEMTMTSPACPMSEMILDDIQHEWAVAFPDEPAPDVRLVWEPPWDPSKMSAQGKQHFGWTPEANEN
ncbi:MAG: metal-sulfur cluster assembly factor [Rhodocyclaceae bacterium]|nr:metal-sulfur cluster assembly factor [Rhodocyclaceae bacterium]